MIPQKLVGMLSRVTILFPHAHVEELRWETQAGTYKPVAHSNQRWAIQTSVNLAPSSIKICNTPTVHCYSGPQRSAPLRHLSTWTVLDSMLCTTCQAIKDNPSAVVLHERCRIGKFVKPDIDLRFSRAGEGQDVIARRICVFYLWWCKYYWITYLNIYFMFILE